MTEPIRALLAQATEHDVILLEIKDGVHLDDITSLQAEIANMGVDGTFLVVPEGIVANMNHLTRDDLLELRSVVDHVLSTLPE